MSSLTFDLHAAAVVAPGLTSLADLRAAARCGRPPEGAAPLVLPSPEALPSNERRRASQVVRLTLACIEQALAVSPFPVDSLRTVFATDEGSGEISQQMLEAVTARQISPMLFTNSVLNAPSGYFSIARRNRQSATVISMGTESFAGGLVCAASEAATTGQPVLLVAYDAAMTAPMNELLPIGEASAAAWVISAGAAGREDALGTFELQCGASDGSSPTPLPAWLPARWSAHSSSAAFAALGLLEAADGAVYRCPLGGSIVSLQFVARTRA